VYKHPEKSFRDHSLFLAERKRYADLFRLKITDYKGWAKGLRKAGYATDKKYPDKLIVIIEKYELYKYDDKVLGKKTKRSKKEKKKEVAEPKFHTVKKGDTLYSLSRKYGLSVDKIKAINGLDSNTISVGQKIYVSY
jgi:LysM repeat protein